MSGSQLRLNILLVDDSEDDAALARAVFGYLKLPHALEVLECPRRALQYLRGTGPYARSKPPKPDMIFLDIDMPGLNGFALLKELKADKDLRHIPVIMLTSSKDKQDVKRSFESGAASFLTKPDSMDGYKRLMCDFNKYWVSVSVLP